MAPIIDYNKCPYCHLSAVIDDNYSSDYLLVLPYENLNRIADEREQGERIWPILLKSF